jgi:DNA-binding NarL/FixJ family response regulator
MGLIGIVEDDPLFAADLESRLRMSADVENVRRWGSAEGYLEYLEAGGTAPSLLMLDLGLPGLGGLDLLRRIGGGAVPVVVLTSIAAEEAVFEALKNGAVGYLLKSELGDLKDTVKAVLEGGAVMTPTIALRVVDDFRKKAARVPAKADPGDETLTPREYEVLELLVCGMTAKEAADSLSLSVHTLRVHVKNIYRKLFVSNKAELMLKAKRLGLF